MLRLHFSAIPSSGLKWQDLSSHPDRLDGLWQSTCFECFVGMPSSKAYLEVNASPSGDWQAYKFSDYRTGQTVSESTRVMVTTQSSLDEKTVTLEVDIRDPDFVTASWQISPTAVLESKDDTLLYFANQHPKDQPDFHDPVLRTLLLPNV